MSIEDDDGGVQSPNASSLPPSNSAMSLAGTVDTPQTAPATLFRAPQPRTAPASAPSRPSASRASVKKYADLLKLTKDNQEVLQKMYDNTLPGEEYLGTLSYLVFVCQESKVSSGSKWVAGKVIRDHFKAQVGKFLFRPDLQAYSKTIAEDHTTMMQSLEVLTFNYLMGLSPEYIDEHGPGDYVAGEACIPTTSMYLFIKETLKNQRSKLRSALLLNILGVPEGCALKVSAWGPMVIQVARTLLKDLRSMDDEAAMLELGPAKARRIIFMRYVTVYYYLNQTENKKRCQWTLMDEALAELHGRPNTDVSLYFAQIARYDREAFTGKETWAAIKASRRLPPPFVGQVLEAARDNNTVAARSRNGNVSRGTSSGNHGMEGGVEEEGDEQHEQ